jgi:glucokinase
MGIAALAHERYPGLWASAATAADLIDLARRHDPAAQAVIAESAQVLGRGIAYLIDLLAPELVVLGSLAVRAGDLFLPIVREIVAAECIPQALPCPVVAAGLGVRIGSTAALCTAIHQSDLLVGRPR